MTTTPAGSTTSRPTGFWASIPRGARLDEASFVSRHRIISAVLAIHPPALAAIGIVRGVSGFLLWGQLVAIVGAAGARAGAEQPGRPGQRGQPRPDDRRGRARARQRRADRHAHLVLRTARPRGAVPDVDAVRPGRRLRRRAPRRDEPLDARIGLLDPPGPAQPDPVRPAARRLPARRGDLPRLRLEVHRGGRPGTTRRAAARRGAGRGPGSRRRPSSPPNGRGRPRRPPPRWPAARSGPPCSSTRSPSWSTRVSDWRRTSGRRRR